MKGFSKKIKTLVSDDGGNVMIMVAAFLATTIAIGGAAIDFGRAQLLQMKQQQAADNAALAAGNILNRNYNESDNADIREATARLYYNINVPATYLGVDRSDPTIEYLNDDRTMAVSSAGQSKTNYTNVNGGNEYINVASATKVVVPEDNTPDFDVAMVVDLSSSTSVQPRGFSKNIIEAEKDALKVMLDSLFPANQASNPNLRFSLVGYSGAIIHAFGLTSVKEQAVRYVNDLSFYYQNYDHYGLEAGLNVLTGRWSRFVSPRHCRKYSCTPEKNTDVSAAVTERGDGNVLSDNRHLVFITDGYIMEEPPPCPRRPCPNYSLFLEQCDAIKRSGITLYTISFVSKSEGDVTALRACASSEDKYFYAPDANTLQSILSGIANRIYSIRIKD